MARGGHTLVSEQAGRTFSQPEFDRFIAALGKDERRYANEHLRDYFTSQPTYPGGGNVVSVDNALRFPVMIARALTDLVYTRFVADRILAKGTPAQVASGAVVFQRSESLFPDRSAEIVNPRSEWPRSGWTPGDWFAALVQKEGLEVPISDEAKRRDALDVLARAQRKLANAVVKFVDGQAMALIAADPAVQTFTTSGLWSNTATDKVSDIAHARSLIVDIDLGYEADTLIMNPAQEISLLTDKNIRDALPREVGNANVLQNSILSGQPVPMLGLRQILVTNQIAAGTMILCNAGVTGSIADEQPGPDESYTGYDPGAGQATIFVKTYREENTDETIVRGARFPAMWISEPKSAVVITGA